MHGRHTSGHDTDTIVAQHTQCRRAPHRARWGGGRHIAVVAVTLLMSAVVLAACSSGAKVTPVTTATVQSAATQVAPTVSAAAATVRTAASAAQPTVAAASTQTAATVQTAGTQVAPTVQSAASAVQPTIASASTQTASTVQAAGTQVSPTIAAAQTAAAPTVAAALTAVAPTQSALATQAIATFGPPVATSTAASPIQITSARVNQDDTTIAVKNSGTGPISISAWIMTLGTFPFILPLNPNLRIQPNATVTLHLSRGTDSATDVYLGQAPQSLVNNLKSGDRIALINLAGQVASVYLLP